MTTTWRSQFAGADWVKESLRPARGISPLGEKVADILGLVFRGIYHLDQKQLDCVQWDNRDCIVVGLNAWNDIATQDGDELTELCILCHDEAIRCAVHARAGNYRRLELCFNQRDRSPSNCEGHKTMEEAISYVRALKIPI
jgi:hypothetical protein